MYDQLVTAKTIKTPNQASLLKRHTPSIRLNEKSDGAVGLAAIRFKAKTRTPCIPNAVAMDQITIQGADNKLGQFLIQDIYATANHRNCLRHSLESCLSLV